jgi:hypothetical protein
VVLLQNLVNKDALEGALRARQADSTALVSLAALVKPMKFVLVY